MSNQSNVRFPALEDARTKLERLWEGRTFWLWITERRERQNEMTKMENKKTRKENWILSIYLSL
jgi:hypothetical protein